MSAGIIYDNGVALTATAAGNLGDVLTSQGSGSAPIFAPGGGGGGAATAFVSYLNNTQNNATGNGTAYTVPFDTATRNDSSILDTTTGIFTSNKTGVWILTSNIFFNASSNLTAVNVGANAWYQNITNADQYFTYFINPYASSNITQSAFCIGSAAIVLLTSGDQIAQKIQVFGSATDDINIVGGAPYYTSFSGVFLGT